MAQGLRETYEFGKKSNRSLKYTYGDGHFVPSGPPRSGVGFDSWVDCYWGWARGLVGAMVRCVARACGAWFSKVCANKNSGITKIYAEARRAADKRESVCPKVACR